MINEAAHLFCTMKMISCFCACVGQSVLTVIFDSSVITAVQQLWTAR